MAAWVERDRNGLVRQFLRKGSELPVRSQAELDHIAALLDERPHKTLARSTPGREICSRPPPGPAERHYVVDRRITPSALLAGVLKPGHVFGESRGLVVSSSL